MGPSSADLTRPLRVAAFSARGDGVPLTLMPSASAVAMSRRRRIGMEKTISGSRYSQALLLRQHAIDLNRSGRTGRCRSSFQACSLLIAGLAARKLDTVGV